MMLPADVLWLPNWAGRIAATAIVLLVALVLLAITRWTERRYTVRLTAGIDPGPARQRRTALSAMATGVRGLVVIGAIIALIAIVFGADSLATITGSAVVVVVLGFAGQRLLADVVAGFFILFENQYAVGDLVQLDPTLPPGIVETLSLRSTVLRTFSGDLITMGNAQLKAAARMSHAMRDMELGVLVNDVEPLTRAVADAAGIVGPGGIRFGSAPVLTHVDRLGDGVQLAHIRVDVPPGFEWMASQLLVDLLRARCGDSLLGDPVVGDSRQDMTVDYQRALKPSGSPKAGS